MEELRIILASASPRRTELLKSAGIPHEIFVTDADETPSGEAPSDMPYAEWYAAEAAGLKAEAACSAFSGSTGDVYIITADTVVTPDGKRIFGKPRDADAAYEMLRELSGGEHAVVGGITVSKLTDGNLVRREKCTCRTLVRMIQLTASQIDAYIASREPFGKAGAYAIQGLASQFIRGIDGDYSNVVGISTESTARIFRESFGLELSGLWHKESAQ